MGRYQDLVNEVLKDKGRIVDGHQVMEVIWETDKVIVFRDEAGKLWRRVHAWGMTWQIKTSGEQIRLT